MMAVAKSTITVEEWLKSIGFDTVETIQAVPSEWDKEREKAHIAGQALGQRMQEIMNSPEYIELREHLAIKLQEEAEGNTLANALVKANNYIRDA